MKFFLTKFSVRHPWLIVLSISFITLFFLGQFPKIQFDTDPENMLSKNEPVRVFHNQVKKMFNLYDFVVVGIVDKRHPEGVFNRETLTRIYNLTKELLSLRKGNNGRPEIIFSENGKEKRIKVDLSPKSLWERMLLKVFHQDPNRLFDNKGRCAVIGHEIISPSLVDSLRQAELGSLKMEYLMEHPPESEAEALRIKNDAMENPLYKGTLVSEDGKAICIYIPIISKRFSHNVANLVRFLTKGWPEKVYITGLPVAEDTFGVEMLVQMATSAPIAGITIFLLLFAFFRRISLIIAPMIIAVVSVICSMGLLIGLGFDVHIMSSMIPIFIIPISVADSVHILSEFFDTYHRFGDKKETILHIVRHLFFPMLYTSLTTIVGFASLATTPIPPVKVFGLHVAFGVALAWVLTISLIPAYIMIFVSKRSLDKAILTPEDGKKSHSFMERFLGRVGRFSYSHRYLIIIVSILVTIVSIFGIFRIRVNDNPVKWFTANHPIRVADRVLNSHFGGTYTSYLVLSPEANLGFTCSEKANLIEHEARKRFGHVYPEETAIFIERLRQIEQLYRNAFSANPEKCFVRLVKAAEKIDHRILDSWNRLADAINYSETKGLDLPRLIEIIRGTEGAKERDKEMLIAQLKRFSSLKGEALLNKALDICDRFLKLSFKEFVYDMQTELTAPPFKRPEILRYMDRLQRYMERNKVVGKTTSCVDALKKAHYELKYVQPPSDATPEERRRFEIINKKNFSIPDSVSAVSQVFTQLEGLKKKDFLFHFVTRDYHEANIWVQLKSGDNRDMEAVVRDVKNFMKKNPPPIPLKARWAGLTYLNVVWQNKMVKGMLYALLSSFVVVLIMMMLLFRSPLFGILSMIPLSITIIFIYGLIGLWGKDYDMPVAVLSSLTLGLSVDFAIHFLERSRQIYKEYGNWKDCLSAMFKEPAHAITRNAITISIGFMPLLIAPLVPYKTVGFFIAMIMAVSWLATLLILPAILGIMEGYVFKRDFENKGDQPL